MRPGSVGSSRLIRGGDEDGPNLSHYAHNNPITHADPTGLQTAQAQQRGVVHSQSGGPPPEVMAAWNALPAADKQRYQTLMNAGNFLWARTLEGGVVFGTWGEIAAIMEARLASGNDVIFKTDAAGGGDTPPAQEATSSAVPQAPPPAGDDPDDGWGMTITAKRPAGAGKAGGGKAGGGGSAVPGAPPAPDPNAAGNDGKDKGNGGAGKTPGDPNTGQAPGKSAGPPGDAQAPGNGQNTPPGAEGTGSGKGANGTGPGGGGTSEDPNARGLADAGVGLGGGAGDPAQTGPGDGADKGAGGAKDGSKDGKDKGKPGGEAGGGKEASDGSKTGGSKTGGSKTGGDPKGGKTGAETGPPGGTAPQAPGGSLPGPAADPATDPSGGNGGGRQAPEGAPPPETAGGGGTRTGEVRGTKGTGKGGQSAERPENAKPGGEGGGGKPTTLDHVVKVAGYWNLEFSADPKGRSGGIPGGMGKIASGWGQGLYLVLTVVDIILTVVTLGGPKAILAGAKAALKAGAKAVMNGARKMMAALTVKNLRAVAARAAARANIAADNIFQFIGSDYILHEFFFDWMVSKGGWRKALVESGPGRWFLYGMNGGAAAARDGAVKKFLGFWPYQKTAVTNKGTTLIDKWDNFVHEGTHVLTDLLLYPINGLRDKFVAGQPIFAVVNYFDEVAAYTMGRLASGRLHAVPMAPINAFNSVYDYYFVLNNGGITQARAAIGWAVGGLAAIGGGIWGADRLFGSDATQDTRQGATP